MRAPHDATNRRRVAVFAGGLTIAVVGAGCGAGHTAAATSPSPTTSPASITTATDAPSTTTTTAAPAPTPTTTRVVTSTTTRPAVTAVAIKGFMFQPNPLHLPVGTTVVWTNDDEILHTVTSGVRTYDEQHLQKDVTPGPPGFDFELDGKGKTATFTFSRAGTFSYLCTRHPGMDAQILVG